MTAACGCAAGGATLRVNGSRAQRYDLRTRGRPGGRTGGVAKAPPQVGLAEVSVTGLSSVPAPASTLVNRAATPAGQKSLANFRRRAVGRWRSGCQSLPQGGVGQGGGVRAEAAAAEALADRGSS